MIRQAEPVIEKEDTALEGREERKIKLCVLGMPGPCEHGKCVWETRRRFMT